MKKKQWAKPLVTTVEPQQTTMLLVCSPGKQDCTGHGTCPSACFPGDDPVIACSVCSGGE